MELILLVTLFKEDPVYLHITDTLFIASFKFP